MGRYADTVLCLINNRSLGPEWTLVDSQDVIKALTQAELCASVFLFFSVNINW